MKILLVRPRPHRATIGLQSVMVCEPLELEYLAAAVGCRHQVVLVDLILEKKPLEHFINKHRPRVVGLTAYIAHVNVVKDYARLIKAVDPAIKVVVGGVHADVVPEDFMDDNIDHVVSGSGVAGFLEIVERLEEGKDRALAKIIGGRRGVPAREELIPPVFPDRQISACYRRSYYYVFHNPCALLKTSYGCPYSCNFCFCREITGGRYYQRDLAGVIEELKQIPEREVYIVDDNFLADRARVERFCGLLQQHALKKRFLIYGRADFIAGNQDTIRLFAQNGLRAVIVGLEAAREEELERYGKGSTVEVNERAVRVLAENGVECYGALILGADYGEEDFTRLYRWLKKLGLRFINLQPFTPLPGTSLFPRYERQLIVPRSSFEQWDLANLVLRPEKMSVSVRPSRMSLRRYYYELLKTNLYINFSVNSASTMVRRFGGDTLLRLIKGALHFGAAYTRLMLKG